MLVNGFNKLRESQPNTNLKTFNVTLFWQLPVFSFSKNLGYLFCSTSTKNAWWFLLFKISAAASTNLKIRIPGDTNKTIKPSDS